MLVLAARKAKLIQILSLDSEYIALLYNHKKGDTHFNLLQSHNVPL